MNTPQAPARVDEILAVHRALYRKQDAAVARALAIDELRAKPYSGLSKGQRQRLDLFIAFAHRPALVALDEPFTGLDRTMTRSVLGLLRGPLAGITIAMICHAGEELAIADDVLWVRDGTLRYQGGKDALKRRLVGEFRALIHVDDDAQAERVRAVLARIDARGHGQREIWFEPGRSLTGNAGILLTRVEFLKQGEEKNFAIVDAAMNDLARPAMYQAFHAIVPVAPRTDVAAAVYDIVGPVCESGDWLGRERSLPIAPGDLLAIRAAGAFGFTLS